MQQSPADFDAYAPPKVAHLVETLGVRKAQLPFTQLLTLGVLAGAFVAFGGMLYTLAITDSTFGFGATRLIGGAAFSLGLVLVVVGGAELFTGNNLLVMAWASRKISLTGLLRNWSLVYVANFAGALATAVMLYLSGTLSLSDNAVANTAMAIAAAKVELPFLEAFVRGILCNTLVCLAIWLCMACRHVSGKVLCIVFPITAFVALGFEHSVANMYLIPVGMLATNGAIELQPLMQNLLPVTLGNVIGGGILVALVYWTAYLRQ